MLPVLLLLASATVRAEDKTQPAPDPALLPFADERAVVKLADGRAIGLNCRGSGAPTVIFIPGQGDWGAVWAKVRPAIAAKTRACTWDRAGYGFSGGTAQPQTLANRVADLAAGLRRGGISGPVILVGHSLGGYESLGFADRYRQRVAGMVMVDPSFPGQDVAFTKLPAFREFIRAYNKQQTDLLGRCAAQVRAGKLKPGGPDPEGCLDYPPDYPPALKAALIKRDATDPARFDAQRSLLDNFEEASSSIVDPKRQYGAMPLIVLTATEAQPLPPDVPDAVRADWLAFQPIWARAHDALAALSTRGTNRAVPGTSHYIQLIKPQAVIEAVGEVIVEARRRQMRSRASGSRRH